MAIRKEINRLNDKKLIYSLKKHRERALLQVMELYGGYTYTIVKNILSGIMQQEDIDEVVSDVYLKLWNHVDNLDETKPLKPYLISIARNEARYKLREYHNNISLEEAGNDAFENVEIVSEIENKILMDEQLAIIKKILDSCSKKDTEIFVRYYYNYEKVREIAIQCNVSESKVKMTLSRLRKKIAKALEDEGYER